METSITIFTRKEKIYKPGFLRKIYNNVRKSDKTYDQDLIFPEELFVEIVGKLLDINVQK